MARIRSIKPSFFASEDVSALPLRARLTWIGLWTHCDDQGRAKDHAKLIKAAVWPLDPVTLAEVEEDLATLAAHGRIVRYEVDGKRYLQVVNWRDHQKPNHPTESRLPAVPDDWHHPPTEPLPDSSGNTPVVLPDSSLGPPARRGEEGRGVGEESSASARASEGREQLQRIYGLNRDQATLVMKKIDHELRDQVKDWPRLLDHMAVNGTLAAVIEPLQQFQPPDPAPPPRPSTTGCDEHPEGAVDPIAPEGWGRCQFCNDRRRRSLPPARPPARRTA